MRISAGEKPQSSSFCVRRASAGWRCSFSMKARAPKRSSIRPFIERSSLIRSPGRARERGGGVDERDRARRVVGAQGVAARRRGPARRSVRCAARSARRRTASSRRGGVERRGVVEALPSIGRRRAVDAAGGVGAATGAGCAAGCGGVASIGLAALQHALAHVVLERQRAHREPLGVLLGAASRASSAARFRAGGAARPRPALACQRAARTGCMPSGAIASTSTPVGGGLGREHDGVVAERLANQAKGFARGARGEAFDVHDGCSDDRADADRMGLRNLAVRQHLQARRGALEQARHRRADHVGHQQAGRVAEVFLALGRFGGALGEHVGHARIERGAVRRVERLRDHPLELGLEGDDLELLGRAVDLLHDRGRQVDADAPRQLGRIGDGGGELGQALDDRAHVADVHAFFEQELQHLLQRGDADHLGDHVFHEFRGQLGDVLDELLRLDAAEQLGGMQAASSVRGGSRRRSSNQRP